MLTITDAQMTSFRRDRLHGLVPRIDGWLAREHRSWPTVPEPQRHAAIGSMIDWADAAGMVAETDYALYCDLMVRIGPDWSRFAGSDDAQEIARLPADEASPPMKLEELTELALAEAEAGRGRR